MWPISLADESQKRITILPDKMSEETKSLVKEILSASNPKPNGGLGTSTTSVDIGANLYEELDQKEANEILVRSSPMEVCASLQFGHEKGIIDELYLLCSY